MHYDGKRPTTPTTKKSSDASMCQHQPETQHLINDQLEALRLFEALSSYEDEVGQRLPGISTSRSRDCFIKHLRQSYQYAHNIRFIANDCHDSTVANPGCSEFDPYKATVLQKLHGDFEEACWLVFLSVHFGKHHAGGWRYVSDVYGKLGRGGRWDWQTVTYNIDEFRTWIAENVDTIKGSRLSGGFGNHRKYESLKHTGRVVATYTFWVQEAGSHKNRFERSAGEPSVTFDELYRSMCHCVYRFGRTACFDYLSLIDKLGLAKISPDKAYIEGATGPLRGARQLFFTEQSGEPRVTGKKGERILEDMVVNLERDLKVGFDVLEDAICNWQKDPDCRQLPTNEPKTNCQPPINGHPLASC